VYAAMVQEYVLLTSSACVFIIETLLALAKLRDLRTL
jgi:hypothetical protein